MADRSSPILQKGRQSRRWRTCPHHITNLISKSGILNPDRSDAPSIPPRGLLRSKTKRVKSRLTSKRGNSYIFLAPHCKKSMLSKLLFLRISAEWLVHIWVWLICVVLLGNSNGIEILVTCFKWWNRCRSLFSNATQEPVLFVLKQAHSKRFF